MIQENLSSIYKELPPDVCLVAVSKFHGVDRIREAYDAGQRVFGESRPQELAAKVPQLPADIRWHFIGHLQTNKLKLVLPYVTLIQSVDSLHLLEAIDRWGAAAGRIVDVLLELHLGAEETKQGFTEAEILDILQRNRCAVGDLCRPRHHEWEGPIACDGRDEVRRTEVIRRYTGSAEDGFIRIRGLMGMASNTDDMAVVEADFRRIESLFKRIREEFPERAATFTELSIGMSGDWPLAVRHGATMVRIGTDIFGPREY